MKTKAKAPSPPIAKVLIVDDDPFLSGVYALGLRRTGFEVAAVNSGAECLEAVKTNRPDVILLDIIMPTMGGFEVLKHLKANPAVKDIPVIVLSSLSQQEDIEQSRSLGAADFMQKTQTLPIEVSLRIRKLLGKLEPSRSDKKR